MELTEEQLSNLLKETQKAHHEYEKTLEGTDPDWAAWYAAYIASRVKESGDEVV